MMHKLLENIVWHTLCGPHAQYATGTEKVRRYVDGFTPFVGFADLKHPDLATLASYVMPGEQLYCDGWAGRIPQNWCLASELTMCKMTWEASLPAGDNVAEAVLLDNRHAPAALALATLTRPGPFSLRSIELGQYLGVFHAGCLVAMACARLCAGGYREISGVCTHPDFRGRGLARGLILNLIRRQMRCGERPFLRVIRDNDEAYRFYLRMGFREYQQSVARVFSLVS